jgi:hypothetical protein
MNVDDVTVPELAAARSQKWPGRGEHKNSVRAPNDIAHEVFDREVI